ncbi:hypothetical protein ACLKA7_010792 [Drosophila subpalustris]
MATASKIGHKNSYVANYNNGSVDDGNEEENKDEEVDEDDGDGIACSSLALSSFGDSIRVWVLGMASTLAGDEKLLAANAGGGQCQKDNNNNNNSSQELELAVGVQLLVDAVATWWVCQLSTRQAATTATTAAAAVDDGR